MRQSFLKEVSVDLLVVGSGPAGVRGAIQAAKLKKKVVLIEKWGIGGSSLHTATIPSKSLRQAICDLTNFQLKSFYSREKSKPEFISIKNLNHRVRWVIEHEKETIIRDLQKNGVNILEGTAKFYDSHSMDVYDENARHTYRIKAKKILLAVGSKPRVVSGVTFDGQKVLNSTQLLYMDRKDVPASLLVIGAGVIGTEYASMFATLGTKVTLVDRNERILSFLDQEIGSLLTNILEEDNLTFLSNRRLKKLEVNDQVTATFDDATKVTADLCFVAAGRVANVDCINLKKVDIELNERGYISVNENYQTRLKHIYAAGDVIGGHCLASTSAEQGRIAIKHAFGQKPSAYTKLFPFGIYTIPDISFIGKTEEQCRNEKINFEVGRADYSEVSRSIITGSEKGLCKIIFSLENHTILGVHIVGNASTEVIHIAQTAIAFGATIEYFSEQVFNYPTYAQMYKIAALNGLNKLQTVGYA